MRAFRCLCITKFLSCASNCRSGAEQAGSREVLGRALRECRRPSRNLDKATGWSHAQCHPHPITHVGLHQDLCRKVMEERAAVVWSSCCGPRVADGRLLSALDGTAHLVLELTEVRHDLHLIGIWCWCGHGAALWLLREVDLFGCRARGLLLLLCAFANPLPRWRAPLPVWNSEALPAAAAGCGAPWASSPERSGLGPGLPLGTRSLQLPREHRQ